MQMTMFGMPSPTKPRQVKRESWLPFTTAIESGRLGDPHAGWTDAVLAMLKTRGVKTDLCELQDCWNHRMNAMEAANHIARMHEIRLIPLPA